MIEKHRPELIIFGKSLILYKEPVSEIKKIIEKIDVNTLIMYDMAHVLGLVGKYYQEPFKEDVDIVTGSTHKTFFGSQRGVIASNIKENSNEYKLWECIVNRTFPGSVSNHHLGTQLGLIVASMEMNYFKDEYQNQVIKNAKSFARALKDNGITIEGSEKVGYTETHQVLMRVNYSEAPMIARRLEKNNVIVNYQSSPDDESSTCASCLRSGVQEMTRFGMKENEFDEIAGYIADVILHNIDVKNKIKNLRSNFIEPKSCLSFEESKILISELVENIIS